MRVVLSQRYRYGGNFLGLVSACNKEYFDRVTEVFREKVVGKLRVEKSRGGNRFARNVSLIGEDKMGGSHLGNMGI